MWSYIHSHDAGIQTSLTRNIGNIPSTMNSRASLEEVGRINREIGGLGVYVQDLNIELGSHNNDHQYQLASLHTLFANSILVGNFRGLIPRAKNHQR
jgi:hypothetical protein